MSIIVGLIGTAAVIAFFLVRISQQFSDAMHGWVGDATFLGIFTSVFTAGGLRESNKASRRWRPRLRRIRNKIDSPINQ